YRYDLSETYARVDIGKPASPEAGQAARDQLERALTLSRKLVADYPGVPPYAAALAQTPCKPGLGLRPLQRGEEAEQVFREGLSIQRAVLKRAPEVTANSHLLAVLETSLARALGDRGRWAEARGLLEAAVGRYGELLKKAGAPRHLGGACAGAC